jgi:hypothetical protein
MSQVQISNKDGFLRKATIFSTALIIAITRMQFHFNLIKKICRTFFFTMFIPTTTQELDSKLHNHIASLLHVLAFQPSSGR